MILEEVQKNWQKRRRELEDKHKKELEGLAQSEQASEEHYAKELEKAEEALAEAPALTRSAALASRHCMDR